MNIENVIALRRIDVRITSGRDQISIRIYISGMGSHLQEFILIRHEKESLNCSEMMIEFLCQDSIV